MDGNGFYYTLSTISQTLAGAFGFLVAVVLYRMQSIKDSLPMRRKAGRVRYWQYGQAEKSPDLAISDLSRFRFPRNNFVDFVVVLLSNTIRIIVD